MTLVVDASVAVKWFVPESDSAFADRLIDADDDLIAPDMLLVEAANAFWKICRRGEMSADQSAAALADLADGVLSLVPSRHLVAAALGLAHRLAHPVHDCLYAALAEREGAGLVTADRRLHERLQGAGFASRVVWLHDVV